MSAFEEYVATLDPKTAKRLQVAQEFELIRLPVASVGLTNALGGGIGAGRVTMFYGPMSTGKSTHALASIAKWQKMGLVCAYVDVEGAFDKAWAERLGVNVAELILISNKKSSGAIEEEIVPHLKKGIDVVIIDSISDIMPEIFVDKTGELNAQGDRKQIGAHAKAITALCAAILYQNEKTAVWLISQVTTKIEPTYVKLVPHGGNKTLHACSQIIKLTSSNTEKQQIMGELEMGDMIIEQCIGRSVEYYVEKNKLGRQSMKGKYDLYYAGDFVGIDVHGEVFDLADKFGFIKKSGAWVTVLDTGEQFNGRPKMIAAMKTDNELYTRLTKKVNDALSSVRPEEEELSEV